MPYGHARRKRVNVVCVSFRYFYNKKCLASEISDLNTNCLIVYKLFFKGFWCYAKFAGTEPFKTLLLRYYYLRHYYYALQIELQHYILLRNTVYQFLHFIQHLINKHGIATMNS